MSRVEGGAAGDGGRMASTPAVLTRSAPVEEPMKTFTPAQPCMRSSSESSPVFSWVPPM